MVKTIEVDYGVFLPKYRHLSDVDADVEILWGGRDSGKSHYIAQRLVLDCLADPKFKCILSRKIQDTIRDSQIATIQDIIDEWGMGEWFDFTRNPLEIRCINGGVFIARGADKSGKVKGVKDPTHAWFEELNQMTREEYAVISTTLRSSDVKTKEYWSFNPEAPEGVNYQDFWLYKIVGEDYSDRIVEKEMDVDGEKVRVKYAIVHSTYADNEFCPPERKAKYLDTVRGDDYMYNVWIRGMWGDREILNPFATHYDESKHVGKVNRVEGAQVVISIDFNIDPFTANLYQMYRKRGVIHVEQFDEMEIKGGTIEAMAREIQLRCAKELTTIQVTGDAMGSNRRIGDRDNKSLFRKLGDELGLAEGQFRIKSNPMHKTSRDQVNYFLRHFEHFTIDERCVSTRRDLRTVQVDETGSILKSNRKKESQRADHLDNFRYFVNVYFGAAIDRHRRTGTWD